MKDAAAIAKRLFAIVDDLALPPNFGERTKEKIQQASAMGVIHPLASKTPIGLYRTVQLMVAADKAGRTLTQDQSDLPGDASRSAHPHGPPQPEEEGHAAGIYSGGMRLHSSLLLMASIPACAATPWQPAARVRAPSVAASVPLPRYEQGERPKVTVRASRTIYPAREASGAEAAAPQARLIIEGPERSSLSLFLIDEVPGSERARRAGVLVRVPFTSREVTLARQHRVGR